MCILVDLNGRPASGGNDFFGFLKISCPPLRILQTLVIAGVCLRCATTQMVSE